MKVRSLLACALSTALVAGCGDSTPPPATPVNAAPYGDLPDRKTPVSGVVFDPEALFYSWITWPVDPGNPNDEPPPPALLDGMPTVIRASTWFAQVSMVDGMTGAVADASGPALPPMGAFQTQGLAPDPTKLYMMRADPTPELLVGDNEEFPAEFGFAPIPAATYFPTVTLRPLSPTGSQCLVQAATMVGDAGALGALAQTLTTETGTATTAASLADPASGRSVVLVWVYGPSPLLDVFMFPSGDVAAETTAGKLYALDWAPPGSGIPGQSAMGFTATPNAVSTIGYYALVVPTATPEPVTLSFVDTVTDEAQHRPWDVFPFVFPVVPGVSFARVQTFEPSPPPEQNPDDAQVPPPDFLSLFCFPQG